MRTFNDYMEAVHSTSGQLKRWFLSFPGEAHVKGLQPVLKFMHGVSYVKNIRIIQFHSQTHHYISTPKILFDMPEDKYDELRDKLGQEFHNRFGYIGVKYFYSNNLNIVGGGKQYRDITDHYKDLVG